MLSNTNENLNAQERKEVKIRWPELPRYRIARIKDKVYKLKDCDLSPPPIEIEFKWVECDLREQSPYSNTEVYKRNEG